MSRRPKGLPIPGLDTVMLCFLLGCPRPSIALQVQNRGLKQSFIHSFIHSFIKYEAVKVQMQDSSQYKVTMLHHWLHCYISSHKIYLNIKNFTIMRFQWSACLVLWIRHLLLKLHKGSHSIVVAHWTADQHVEQSINPTPVTWFIIMKKYSLTVQNRGLKHHSFPET